VVKPKGDYIGGKFVRRRHPDSEIPSVDPGDSEVILGDFPVHDAAPDEALAAARAAFPAWAALPSNHRLAALRKLRAELRNRGDELATVLAAETGRPLWETREEILLMHLELDGYLEHALAELSLCHAPPGRCNVEFRPIGVVVVLSPYPQAALLTHFDTVAALVAGCTVVCKPSELTPATAQLYAEIVHEADLPRGVFNLVQGDDTVGKRLALSPQTDGVLFAGSIENGRHLLQELAATPASVRVLVSGHPAALVLDDARLDEAAYQIVIGTCTTTGQRCTSTRRLVVQKRVADRLLQQLVSMLQQLKVGYSADPGTFMGPLVSSRVVDSYVAELKRVGGLGGKELVHGAPLSSRRRGCYVTPSLHLVEPAAMKAVCDREVVGPMLVATVVDTLEQGLELIAQSPFNLVTSVFCRSQRTLARVQQLAPVGLCLQNLPTTYVPIRLPLQPWNTGANGLSSGTLTARACTRLVTTVEHDTALDVTMLPPGLPRE
jgi:succinylglutamic semialdehyde dehydrogenase